MVSFFLLNVTMVKKSVFSYCVFFHCSLDIISLLGIKSNIVVKKSRLVSWIPIARATWLQIVADGYSLILLK